MDSPSIYFACSPYWNKHAFIFSFFHNHLKRTTLALEILLFLSFHMPHAIAKIPSFTIVDLFLAPTFSNKAYYLTFNAIQFQMFLNSDASLLHGSHVSFYVCLHWRKTFFHVLFFENMHMFKLEKCIRHGKYIKNNFETLNVVKLCFVSLLLLTGMYNASISTVRPGRLLTNDFSPFWLCVWLIELLLITGCNR